MKLKHTLSLLALATCAAVSTSALAQQANVDFEGRILDTICTGIVAGDAGTVRLTGALVSELPNTGDTAKLTRFPVELTGCDPNTANYQINFSSTSQLNGRLPNASGNNPANGLSLQLRSDNGSILQFTSAPDTSRIPPGVDPGADIAGSGTVFYQVEYYNEGGLSAGEYRASATMTLTFL